MFLMMLLRIDIAYQAMTMHPKIADIVHEYLNGSVTKNRFLIVMMSFVPPGGG